MSRRLMDYQTKTKADIISKLRNQNIVVLEGKNGLGKSTIVNNIYFPEYKSYLLRGTYNSKMVEFSIFKKDFYKDLSLVKTVGKDTINSILMTMASVVNASVDYSDSILELFDKATKDDFDNIVGNIVKKSKKQKMLLIFDEINYYDFASMLMLNYIFFELTRSQRIKILIVIDSEFNYQIHRFQIFNELLKHNSVTLAKFSNSDIERLQLNNKEDSSFFLSQTAEGLQGIIVNNLFSDVNCIMETDLHSKVILQTIQLFNEPVSLQKIADCIPEYNLQEIEFHIEKLIKSYILESIENEEGTLVVAIRPILYEEMSRLTPNYIMTHRSDIYIKFLNKFAPQEYFEKFIHHRKVGDSEEMLINGVLAYCFIVRENKSISSEKMATLLDFIENSMSKSSVSCLKEAYSFYIHEEYEQAFKILNAFQEKHDPRFESPEIWAEIVYLRALSLGRLDNCSEVVSKYDIKTLQKNKRVVSNLGNKELALRLNEALVFLYNVHSAVEQAKNMKKEFFNVLDQYSIQIRKSNLRNKKFWQVRYAVLGSKIDLIDISDDKMPLMEKCYETLYLYKNEFPKQYLRAACSYAGRNLWEKQYDKVKDSLEQAIQFINEYDLSEHWGIIYHVYYITSLIRGVDPAVLLSKNKELMDNDEIREKMHEKNIYTSNHSVLLATNGDLVGALEAIDSCLVGSIINNYDRYLLLTNKSVLEYMLGNTDVALDTHMQITKIIDEGIPNFDKVFIKKREARLLEIFNNREPITDTMKPIRKPADQGAMKNNSDIYFRPLLISNIVFWVN